MTVSTTTNRINYTGNGVTTVFAFPYKFIATADLVVYVAGVQLLTGFTVGTPTDSGANVTFTTAPANGAAIIILANPAQLQSTSLPSTGPFPAKAVETALDKLTLLIQRVSELATRSFRLSDSDTSGASTVLPTPTSNALIGWNQGANALQNVDPTTLATIVAFGTANADVFTGTGAQTVFTLSANPGAQANLDVAVGGVTQLPNTDYTWIGGTTVTFAVAPPNGVKVLVRYFQGLPQGVTDSAASTYVQAGVGAVNQTVQLVLREQWLFTSFGAVFDGVTDDTAAINKAILAAYKAAANVLSPYGEIYSITIKAPAGKDCKILGKILLPSQIILDFNGSRIAGITPTAGSIVYDPSGQHLIETAYYDSGTGTLISNAGAATETTWRVVAAGVKNASFLNANCCLNFINFQELSHTENITVSNVSAYMRLKSCFYSTHSRTIVRNSAKFAGSNAILMYGVAGHRHTFTNVYISGASTGLRTTCTTALGCTFKDGSFEGAYNAVDGGGVDGTGIVFDTGYSEAWSITGNYIEGIRWGIRNTGGGTCNSFDISSNEFNTDEYAVLAGVNGFRNTDWSANATFDGGGIIRNLVDFSATGNDVRVQLPSKLGSGLTAFLANFRLGNFSTAVATSVWSRVADSVAIAKSEPSLINQSSLNSFPFEGAQILTTTNEPPFVTLTRAVNTLTVLTTLIYDLSNNLVFNFFGNTDAINYQLCGKIYGATVVWDVRTPVGCVLTVNNSGGYVQLVFTNLTAAVPIINVSGTVRHM